MSTDQVLYLVYNFILALWSDTVVKVIVFQVSLNFVAAIAAAVATGAFKVDKLIEVFYRKLLPLVMIYAASRVVSDALSTLTPGDIGGVFDTLITFVLSNLPLLSLVAIEALLIKDLLNSLAQIPGLQGMTDAVPSKLANTVFDRDTMLVASANRRAPAEKLPRVGPRGY